MIQDDATEMLARLRAQRIASGPTLEERVRAHGKPRPPLPDINDTFERLKARWASDPGVSYDTAPLHDPYDDAPPPRREPRSRPPDALLTMAEAAAKLGCGIRTLKGHVQAGTIRYVSMGHGTKRPRRMFTLADINDFINSQTRKDAPACRSTETSVRRIGNSTSRSEVIAFTALRKPGPSGKPKP